jgi:predicted nucleotide-binding protein (sugar kinase/HSP70/actin superfamily)
MKITFPHLGNAYICVKSLLDDMGIDYVIPPFNNKKALEIGTKHAPELACLPLKINIGNYIQAAEKGADTILMAGGCGPCRFGYYCEMHREIMRDIGYPMDIITMEMPDQGIRELLRRCHKLTGSHNLPRIIHAFRNVARISRQVDELERLTFHMRPREIKKGTTDRIYKAFLNKARCTPGADAIMDLIRHTRDELSLVETDRDRKPLKIGIVGEIYTTIDSYANLQLESKLGILGIEVDRSVTVSGWIYEHIIKQALHLPRDKRYAEVAKPYLGTMIGGHAQETIGNTILYAEGGYDGVVQVYPLTCMPEIVAESILPAVERDFDIPVLTLIIDEMTGEAGYMTRLEAFADLLIRRREEMGSEGKRILSGN